MKNMEVKLTEEVKAELRNKLDSDNSEFYALEDGWYSTCESAPSKGTIFKSIEIETYVSFKDKYGNDKVGILCDMSYMASLKGYELCLSVKCTDDYKYAIDENMIIEIDGKLPNTYTPESVLNVVNGK